MIQINTSGEERKLKTFISRVGISGRLYSWIELEKSGISRAEVVGMYAHVKEKCAGLNVLGLMTIGSYEQSTNPDEINIDFKVSHDLA